MNLKVDNGTNFGQLYNIRVSGSDENTIKKAAKIIKSATKEKAIVQKASAIESYFLAKSKMFFTEVSADLDNISKKNLYSKLLNLRGDKTVGFTEIA